MQKYFLQSKKKKIFESKKEIAKKIESKKKDICSKIFRIVKGNKKFDSKKI